MRCQEAFEAISARFDGELRPAEAAPLEAHLAGCPTCRAHAAELGPLARRLRGAAAEQPPVPAALRARIQRAVTPPAPRRMPFVFGLAFLGAGAALGAVTMVARARPTPIAVIAVGSEVTTSTGQLGPGASLAAGDEIIARDRPIELTLGEGGRLALAPGGRLRFEQSAAQIALVAGRAEIELDRATAPLVLNTAGGAIRMDGGRFEVQAGESATEDNVEAAHNAVSVLAHRGRAEVSNEGQTVALRPGVRGWLRSGEPPLIVPASGAEPARPLLAGLPGGAGTPNAGWAKTTAAPGTTTAGPVASTAPAGPAHPGLGRVKGTVAAAPRSAPSGRDDCAPRREAAFVHLAPQGRTPAPLPAAPETVPVSIDRCGTSPTWIAVGRDQALELRNDSDAAIALRMAPEEAITTVAAHSRERLRFGTPGPRLLYCGSNGMPCGHIVVTERPVLAVADVPGDFTLEGIPSGLYELTAWRPPTTGTNQMVLVPPGATAEVSLQPPGHRERDGAVLLASVKAGDGCRLSHADTPVGEACAKGGINRAKKTMKNLLRLARERGTSFECDSCHRNENTWDLTDDGRARFFELLRVIRT
jgi:anti-sigma factor RsiW